MPKQIASSVYNFYGRFYDGFEFLFRQRLARAIDSLPLRDGDRVLDIGVGTGLSLEFYPDTVQVTGLDLSAGMLQQAAHKLDTGKIRNDVPRRLTQLVQGDALKLPFADGSFDCVFMSHVIATVPDPYRAMHEALRVCRDNACLALVNHFRNPFPLISWVETAIDPLCRKLGWRSDLSLRELLGPLGVNQFSKPRGFIFQTVYLQKHGSTLRMLNTRTLTPLPAPTLDPAQG